MSRHIFPAAHLEKEHELYRKSERQNKILITENTGVLYAFLLQNGRIYKVSREEKTEFPVGCVVIGRVENVVKQMEAAFVNLKGGSGREHIGYLSLQRCKNYTPLNRTPDGRVLCGDEILVQVIKEPLKTKQMQLTTDIRLPESPEKSESFSENDDKNKNDSDGQQSNIDQLSQTRTLYSILYKPEIFYHAFIEEQRKSRLSEIVTDKREVYQELLTPGAAWEIPVRLYEDDKISLAKTYALNTHIRELLSPKVYMKSGAYLVVEPTEALVSIDVNSGKADRKNKPEEYYLRINLEAAKEVCYQLSARNLSGMILVDFINMEQKAQVQELISFLKEECAKDSVPTRYVDYTKLGLAEITRKKTHQTLRYMMRDWDFSS